MPTFLYMYSGVAAFAGDGTTALRPVNTSTAVATTNAVRRRRREFEKALRKLVVLLVLSHMSDRFAEKLVSAQMRSMAGVGLRDDCNRTASARHRNVVPRCLTVTRPLRLALFGVRG